MIRMVILESTSIMVVSLDPLGKHLRPKYLRPTVSIYKYIEPWGPYCR